MILKDKVAVVTGGCRGIGKSIAEEMAREGAKLALIDVDFDDETKLVQSIEKNGGEAILLKVDVANREEIKEAVENIINTLGKIDILVNNAGIAKIEKFLEGDEEYWDKMIDVNLTGLMLCSKTVLPYMFEKKYGKIINIASGVAVSAANMQVVYSATKGGVIAFTRSLAAEVAKYHINVNSICPGFVITPMTNKAQEVFPELFKKMQKSIPWGRPAQPSDIANLSIFLSSDESEYITGQNIVIDGGLTGV